MPRDNFFSDDSEQTQADYPLHKHQRTKRQVSHRPRLAEYAEGEQHSTNFAMTYRPAIYEDGWLRSSLRDFYAQNLISDVQAQVKGGKEASVYRCAAHAQTGMTLLAAKVYRPRIWRASRAYVLADV